MVDTNFCINIVRRQRKGPLWEGAPAKRVGERAYNLIAAKDTVSPSVSFADSSLAEGAFWNYL